MADIKVPLERKFSLVVPGQDTEYDDGWQDAYWSQTDPVTWENLDREYRTILLASAGTGKTYEALHRAEFIAEQGKVSFFIRIEELDSDFEDAFEVGDSDQFEAWLTSVEEAWFFLDSVDEARLDSPKAFEKAVKCFAKRIKPAMHRAHIVITSRPYSWRSVGDKALVDRYLPFYSQDSETNEKAEVSSKDEETSSVQIYRLKALDLDDIRYFAHFHSTSDIEQLVESIQRSNLIELASRPFELEALLLKWEKDRELGSRLIALRHLIDIRLQEIDVDRRVRQPLNKALAHTGACRLAAAVTLSSETGILVPDNTHERTGVSAETVLADWEKPDDVRMLLERAVFNGILYGAVRFRHRDIRELLAAEWINHLLQHGNSRSRVESLLFRERYGEKIIVPRFRPLLPWLILFDDEIRERVLALNPEIAVEGGDPASLPLHIRQRILKSIVERIVSNKDGRGARDNSAIARIAQNDLSEDTLNLITENYTNDDAIFYLGRLVWQGEMNNCVEVLAPIALDASRDVYARIASTRAVSSVGSQEQLISLWRSMNIQSEMIPRRLLVELMDHVTIDEIAIGLLLSSIEKLPPDDKYEASDLDQTFHNFINRIEVLQNKEELLSDLCNGINNLLSREPYYERRKCRVSKDFNWLIGAAIHVVEILVCGHFSSCFGNAPIEILLKLPAIRDRGLSDYNEYKDTLSALIPNWQKFNDEYFWRTVEEVRKELSIENKRLTDSWDVEWLDHYWKFGPDDFSRVIGFIRSRPLEDDQLLSLTLAFRIYMQKGQPFEWKSQLEDAVEGQEFLIDCLNKLMAPEVEEARKQREKKRRERERERKREKIDKEQDRISWIERLRDNPDDIRNPPDLAPGECTYDQWWLFKEIDGDGSYNSRSVGDWRFLIKEFGEEVALAYRDSVLKLWRQYKPKLRSEGDDTSSFSYSSRLALTGLEIESKEVEGFPKNLTNEEVAHAFRYLVWEINGFPSCFESLYKEFPREGFQAVWKELQWELENTVAGEPLHYVLTDIVHHAPWLHSQLSPHLLKWINENLTAEWDVLHYCFQIMDGNHVSLEWFSNLAQLRVKSIDNTDELVKWYALWVGVSPDTGIAALKAWLASLNPEVVVNVAEKFVVRLVGDRSESVGWTFAQEFQTVPYLVELYILMHRYIRVEDDINRTGGGVYSPGLRDHAQHARNDLLNLLAGIPGKETYIALRELSESHPVESHRALMAKHAYRTAEKNADESPWTDVQIYEFSEQQEREPITHHQLFELGVQRLNDFREWLELGNDSLYDIYQKATNEAEVRRIVANWLNTHAKGRYTCAQENPLANEQRPDIWLQHSRVLPPVPIELKLLDKGWSGPDLCERLRNQLVGDYLREKEADSGILLLIWQGSQPNRRWEIGGERVDISGLQQAITNYWNNISSQFPDIVSVEVIVVDLTRRAVKANLGL